MDEGSKKFLNKNGRFFLTNKNDHLVKKFSKLFDIQKYAALHCCYILQADEITSIDLDRQIRQWGKI